MRARGLGRTRSWTALLAAVTIAVALLVARSVPAVGEEAAHQEGPSGKLVVEYVEKGSAEAYKVETGDLASFEAAGGQREVTFCPFDNERGGGVTAGITVAVDGSQVEAPTAVEGSVIVPEGATTVVVRTVLDFSEPGGPAMVPETEDVPPDEPVADDGEAVQRPDAAGSGAGALRRVAQAAVTSPEVSNLVVTSHYQHAGIMLVNFYGSNHGIIYCAQRTNTVHPADGETYNIVSATNARSGLTKYWRRMLDYVLATGYRDDNHVSIGGFTGEHARTLTQAAVWSIMEGNINLCKTGTGKAPITSSAWNALYAWLLKASAYANGSATTYDNCSIYGYSSKGHQAVVVFGHLPPAKGKITLQKHDADDAKTTRSLAGAVYVISTARRDASKAVGQFVTDKGGVGQLQDRSGKAMTNAFSPGTYYVWEEKSPAGFVKDTATYTVKVTSGATTAVNGAQGVSDHEDAGWGYVRKSSANTAVTSGNAYYKLEGTTFVAYDAKGAKKATLKVQADGTTAKARLDSGTYWVHETVAGTGYLLCTTGGVAAPNAALKAIHNDKGWKQLTVTAQKTTAVDFADQPAGTAVGLVATKFGADGKTPLAGAEFTVRYYDNTAGTVTGTPKATWVLKTDSKGEARLDAAHKVSGSAFYSVGGKTGLPIGTVSVQETKAPTGYVRETLASAKETDKVSKLVDKGGEAPLHVQVLTQGSSGSVKALATLKVLDLPVPGIGTVATVDGSHEAPATGTMKLVDKVSYVGLTAGKEYQMVGTVHLVGDGGGDAGVLKDASGNPVTASATFTPTSHAGTVDVTFSNIDATRLAGQSIVVFEQCKQGDKVVASHEDASDEGQTVTVSLELPMTGATAGPAQHLAAWAAAIGMVVSALARCRLARLGS